MLILIFGAEESAQQLERKKAFPHNQDDVPVSCKFIYFVALSKVPQSSFFFKIIN
jgi:hypothetical protein